MQIMNIAVHTLFNSSCVRFFLLPPPAIYHLVPQRAPQQPALGDGWWPLTFILDHTILKEEWSSQISSHQQISQKHKKLASTKVKASHRFKIKWIKVIQNLWLCLPSKNKKNPIIIKSSCMVWPWTRPCSSV